MDRFLMPIVQTEPDTGNFSVRGDAASRDGMRVSLEAAPIRLLPEYCESVPPDDAFDRVGEAYDLDLMAQTRLVIVGVGGAAGFAESMARAGIGEFVLVDPDVIELPNIGTQHVYRRDVGRPKVDAVAERIIDVSSRVRVVTARASSTNWMIAR